MYLLGRIIYFIGGLIVTILGLRLLLVLFGASGASPFVNFIYQTSEPFVRPFFGIFNYSPSFGAARFEFVTLIAIVIYAIATAIVGSMFGYNRRSVV